MVQPASIHSSQPVSVFAGISMATSASGTSDFE
jgi:hypothetical protein